MKLKDILLENSRDDAALEFLSNLVKNGPFKNKVFLAGGSPRDMELGLSPKDLDVVVKGGITAGIDFANWATKELGNHKEGSNPVVFPTYGTAKFTLRGVVYNGHDLSDVDVECVAPRKEKYTPGSRKPEVSGGELEDDVLRRDFSVNSLLRDLTTGETLDLTGMGKADIKAGIIRTPLDPDIIFGEDPLRILRAVRFAAKYNWKLPMFMLRSIKKNAHQLANISKERIHDETNKMLLTDYPYKAFRILQILDLMQYVFPALIKADIEHMRETKKLKKTLEARLVSVFVNIEPSVVQKNLSTLRYSINHIRPVIASLTVLPGFIATNGNLSDEILRAYHFTIPDYFWILLDYATVYLSNFDVSSIWDRYTNLSNEMDTNPIPVTGEDLIASGMKPGPEFKNILDAFKKLYLKNPLTPKSSYLSIISKK